MGNPKDRMSSYQARVLAWNARYPGETLGWGIGDVKERTGGRIELEFTLGSPGINEKTAKAADFDRFRRLP